LHDYLLSLFLGIVEGLTEFLPVSSTAHLRIVEELIGRYSGWQFSPPLNLQDGFWKMYSIVIQLGAILCLPIYFRSRIARFLSTFPHGERDDRTALTHPLTLVMLAFVVTAIPALLLHKMIGDNLENMRVFGWSLLIGGIIMWVVDARFGNPRSARHMTERMEDVSVFQAIWIGICQIASAVFPGTSRSMSTIAAGQVSGMSRTAALEFSFFLSMPTMVAATFYDLFKTFHPKHGAEALGRMPVDGHEWIVLLIGFVVSFIVALAVVAWFMNWVRRRGFTPFAIYRIIVGIAVLVWVMKGQ
jgi:undecaprenyl-diphosphatase